MSFKIECFSLFTQGMAGGGATPRRNVILAGWVRLHVDQGTGFLDNHSEQGARWEVLLRCFETKDGAVYFCAFARWCNGGILCGRSLFREDT